MTGLGVGVGSPLGGGNAPPFTLLSSVDQVAVGGVSPPFDPGGLAGVGTGFTPATGRFRWVVATDGVVRDGYRENGIGWTKRIVDLYPNYDPDLDIIELCLKVITPPPNSATVKWGMAYGILDEGTAGAASWDGPMWGFKANTATTFNHGSMGQTSDSFGNAMAAGTVPQLMVTAFRQAAGTSGAGVVKNEVGSLTRVRSTAGVWEESDLLAAPPMVETPPNWVIHIRDVCDSATGALGVDQVAELYHRRIRTAGMRGVL